MLASPSKDPLSTFRASRRCSPGILRIWSVAATALGLALSMSAAQAQTGGPLADTVSWTVSAQSDGNVKQGGRLTLKLHGDVVDGWHVYAQEQLPNGPIPLLVTLKLGDVASADGATTATPPTKFHDPSFNLDTQYYARDFSLTVPVRIAANAAAGPQQIPVNVRFQTCNGQTCRPPKTVTLSASINVHPAG